jgi:hypothetical protein
MRNFVSFVFYLFTIFSVLCGGGPEGGAGSRVWFELVKHVSPPFINKKILHPLRDEGNLRGTTPITFNVQTSLVRYNGHSRRRLLDSPAQSLLRVAGEFGLTGAPAGAVKGFHLALPSR